MIKSITYTFVKKNKTMCTVSFHLKNDIAILTSNRDEKTSRSIAVAPKNYLINSKKVIFPKDPLAGGTWFAVDEYGSVLILLNGATEKHETKPPYKKSRGIIALELIGANKIIDAWHTINLDNIEPFTIVLYSNQQLYQLQWNGIDKNKQILDINQQHIWSSSTLYEKKLQDHRAERFSDFVKNNQNVDDQDIIDFHSCFDNKNQENGIVIDRNNFLKTVSISQVVMVKNKVKIKYLDLINKTEFVTNIIKI